MTPLGTMLKPGSGKPPKIDEHSLFTSIQVSVAVLEGDLQIYEPWKKKKNHPKQCHVILYTNETSPFLVWYKVGNGRRPGSVNSTEHASSSAICKPRCVVPVSRSNLAKTTGGSFELTDFASKLTFRFVAKTIREAESWVEKLAEESLREANLDLRSICSSRSSYSSMNESYTSRESSDSTSRLFNLFSSENQVEKKKSVTESTGSFQFHEKDNNDVNELISGRSIDTEKDDVFYDQTSASSQLLTLVRRENRQFENDLKHPHLRAQPHLGLHVVLDKRRPDLRSVINNMPKSTKTSLSANLQLPLSEHFLHVPNS